MPILRQHFLPLARLCALAASVCICGAVLADDFPTEFASPSSSPGLSGSSSANPNSPAPSNANLAATALTKLHDLGSRVQGLGSRASELAMQAFGLLGTHYQRGGNTPESGMDCSGLVRHVFKEAWGAILPRSALEMSRIGQIIPQQDLKPGDLVFYNTMRRGFSHVGIYLGDSKFIHSPAAGGQVRIESMDLAYWKNRFNGARRMDEPQQQQLQQSQQQPQ